MWNSSYAFTNRERKHGLGRHFKDPGITAADIKTYSYHIWQSQIINLIAVAILKYSICAYLLALKFSTIYNIAIYFSIVMVTVFSLIVPMLDNFDCRPFEANWNRAVNGHCFYKGTMGMTCAFVPPLHLNFLTTRLGICKES